MWEVLIHPHGPLDWRTGKIEKPDEVYITVRPGLWTTYFLGQAGSKAREAMHQFSNLALNLLRLDLNDNELTLRLAIHLTLDARMRASDPHPYEYQVKPLLTAVLPEDVMQQVQESSEAAGLFDHWSHALKLLGKLGWRPEENSLQLEAQADQNPVFYVKPYPKWLEPESSFRKPRGWVNYWLEQRLILKPPILEPERLALIHANRPDQQTLQPLYTGNLTGTEVRAARQARNLTQTELAGLLQVHQSLVARIELGDRTISPTLEASLRQVLGLEGNG
jgi:DNA-binding transcriptional regulator YiaG